MTRPARHRPGAEGALLLLCAASSWTTMGHARGRDDADGTAEAAEPAEKIGLRDALRVALRENPAFETQTADVEAAEGAHQQAQGADDWLFEAGFAWAWHRSAGRPPSAGHPDEDPLESRTAFLALSRRLPTGGRLRLSVDTRMVPGSGALAAEPGTAEATAATGDAYAPVVRAVLVQPLLRGFGSDAAAAAKNSTAAARDAERLERESAAADLVRDVAHAYWELAYANGDLAIRRRSLALAREHRRITKAGVNVKRLAPVELTAVDQTIAVREEEVLLAEQAVTERSLELRRLLGVDIDPAAPEILASDGLDAMTDQPDLDGALAAAYRRNGRLRSLAARRDAAAVELAAAEDGLLPQLDLTAGVASSGSADTLDAAFDQVGARETVAWTAGVLLSIPLGNNAAEGAHAIARAHARRARLAEDALRAEVAVAVARAVKQVRSAGRRIDLNQTAITLAEQNLEAEEARWQAGHATNFDVMRRQDELAQSLLRLARARADYLESVATLEALTGEILARYDVSAP